VSSHQLNQGTLFGRAGIDGRYLSVSFSGGSGSHTGAFTPSARNFGSRCVNTDVLLDNNIPVGRSDRHCGVNGCAHRSRAGPFSTLLRGRAPSKLLLNGGPADVKMRARLIVGSAHESAGIRNRVEAAEETV